MEDNFNTGMPESTETTDTTSSTSYSEPTRDYSSSYSPEPEGKQTLAMVSMGLGIAADVFALLSFIGACCCCVGWLAPLLGIAAIVCGIIVKVKKMPGDKFALIGILTGAGSFLILGIVTIVGIISAGGVDAFTEAFKEGYEQGSKLGTK